MPSGSCGNRASWGRGRGWGGGRGSWPRPSVRAASAPASLCVPFRVRGSVPQVPLLPSARTLVPSSSSLRLALSPFPISRPLCFISPFAFTTGERSLMGGSLCWTPQHALHRPCRRLRALEQPRSLSACRLPEPWSARGAPSPVLWRHLWALAENIGQARPAQPAGLQPL